VIDGGRSSHLAAAFRLDTRVYPSECVYVAIAASARRAFQPTLFSVTPVKGRRRERERGDDTRTRGRRATERSALENALSFARRDAHGTPDDAQIPSIP